VFHYLFIRFAFTVFVSFAPLVINSFLYSFIQSVSLSFILSFLPWVCVFMPGEWVRLRGMYCSRTGVRVNETISVFGNNNRILGFNTTIRNAPSVAWGSPRTHVVLRFAVGLIQNQHLQGCWHTNWMESLAEMVQRQTQLHSTRAVYSTREVQNKYFWICLWVTLRAMFSAAFQPYFSSREKEFIGRIVSREWKNATF